MGMALIQKDGFFAMLCKEVVTAEPNPEEAPANDGAADKPPVIIATAVLGKVLNTG